jgi:hypothetical protein
MPSAMLKSLAKKANVSIDKAEGYWKEAKKSAAKTFGTKESNFGDKEWKYVTSIVTRRLGLSESNTRAKEASSSLVSDVMKGVTPVDAIKSFIDSLEAK